MGGEGFYHLHKPLKGASLAARAVWGPKVNPNPPTPTQTQTQTHPQTQTQTQTLPKEENVATVKGGSFGQAELSYQRKVSR